MFVAAQSELELNYRGTLGGDQMRTKQHNKVAVAFRATSNAHFSL
jgi:hypothetical protein